MGDSEKKASSGSTSSSVTQNDMTLQITPDKLDGSNYSSWSRSVKLYILGRGKWGYITGTKATPTEADVLYSTWEEENAMVQCWLLNSMTRNLRAIFLSLSTAKEVWDAVTQTYSIGKDASKLYELRCKALATRQNGTSLSDYYGTLQLIWQEIDVLRPSKMKCSDDVAARTTEISNERLYDFLAGLDHHLDRIRGQVLAEDPLPSVQAAYAQVCSEANRQATMLAGSHVDGSAMTTTLHRPVPRSGHPKPGQKELDTRQCTHCGKKKHTRETCFELVGYPDWWVDKQEKGKEKKKSVANLASQPLPHGSSPHMDQSALRVFPNTTSTSSPYPGSSDKGADWSW
ncbi:uncharacterized protein LOC110758528 [Prunus avium]|uniref:Uncharacterized protein LOC110755101 n=3 Tax=Prunus avium TaxID=42229 RepID=A0A6P5SC42_PRUAV|nr:uncharacterized protein LOC110755101 [Prunus avium]XP_021816097.1 uncharacterized protein LOC110758528 [Prunus avium]